MAVEVSEETEEQMQALYAEGLKVAEIARRFDVPYLQAYIPTRLRERGYESYNEYQIDLAKRRGKKSRAALEEELKKKNRGHPSRTAHQAHLARESSLKEGGFESTSAYQAYLEEERQQRLLNQRLGALIKRRLEELGETQRWLAGQLGVNEGTVSRYASGKMLPITDVQEKLFEVLDVPYENLDDLLE